MIILWIDPWTTTIWFSLIKKEKWNLDLLDYWVFKTTPKIDLSLKLLEIWNDINFLINKFKPELIVVEKLFFKTNLKTWIDVAQARWVILYESIKNNIKLLEHTPLEVKKAITWNGKANKSQLQKSIKILFKLNEIPTPDDAADAIWLAYIWALNINNLFK